MSDGGGRKRPAAGDWPIATGAREAELQRQKAIMLRFKAWEQVEGGTGIRGLCFVRADVQGAGLQNTG